MTQEEETDYKISKVIHEFIMKNKITCPECISQSDNVIENAYGFIEKLCDIAGYYDSNTNTLKPLNEN